MATTIWKLQDNWDCGESNWNRPVDEDWLIPWHYPGLPMVRIVRYKNRSINFKKPVRIYRNLKGTKSTAFSIWQGGKVVGHTSQIFLADCKFIVSEKSRQRVLKTKQKNVHAFIKGVLGYTLTTKTKQDIFYDPYKGPFFHTSDATMVKTAEAVYIQDGKVQAIGLQ